MATFLDKPLVNNATGRPRRPGRSYTTMGKIDHNLQNILSL